MKFKILSEILTFINILLARCLLVTFCYKIVIYEKKMKKIAYLFVIAFVILSCKTTTQGPPQVQSFDCQLSLEDFSNRAAGIISYGGFDIVHSDTAGNALMIIAQRIQKIRGGKETAFDQIRLRYDLNDNKVWASYGIMTNEKKVQKYLAPTPEEDLRMKEDCQRTIDRIFMQCNPGQFPNRP